MPAPVRSDSEERTLVAAAAAGDKRAASELIERHWSALFRVADLILRDVGEAEDATQEALISAFGALDGFDADRPLRPWLIGIVTNKAIDRSRRRRRQPVELSTVDAIAAPEAPSADDAGLRAALEALEPDARALLVLRYVLEYRSAEIGELLGMPAGSVRSRLKRSLDQVRSAITEETP